MPQPLPTRPAPSPRPPWDAWSDDAPALPAGARVIASTLLHGRPHPVPRRAPAPLPPTRLTAEQRAALAAVTEVDTSDEARVAHLGGKSTIDLLRRRLGVDSGAPDAIVRPGGHDEVAAVLRVCDENGIVVVPFGGGTSVVGGVDPVDGVRGAPGTTLARPVVTLDLSRTAALLAVDEVSRLATFGAGTTGPQAEQLLAAYGWTLGHFPQSYAYATLGGFAATRSAGQASRGYGRFDDLTRRLRIATPTGELDLGRAPASAAGPDLRELFLGSEGTLGVITEVTVTVRPTPAATAYGAWTLPDFTAGAAALRELTQRGVRPTVIRLSDGPETRVNAALGGHLTRLRGCLAIATAEGETAAAAASLLSDTDAILRGHGAKPRGDQPARSWERGRFASPALRDTLLGIGVLAETLETATTWANLERTKAAVTAALHDALTAAGTKPVVTCHISHVYPSGASLYFTVVAALTADPIGQWTSAKHAASRAIVDAGATISHHHAVGRDHRAYLGAEIGEPGVRILRAVKDAVDPRGIMNPGVLIAADAPAPTAPAPTGGAR
ncbi:FAD-binding oxidoreductase [Microbacterium sp.]|uniref:FAD-binding oxidoreductase n=1 Tax=Microbacterium sp. TaxID=51671 RepID=UPI003A91D9BC